MSRYPQHDPRCAGADAEDDAAFVCTCGLSDLYAAKTELAAERELNAATQAAHQAEQVAHLETQRKLDASKAMLLEAERFIDFDIVSDDFGDRFNAVGRSKPTHRQGAVMTAAHPCCDHATDLRVRLAAAEAENARLRERMQFLDGSVDIANLQAERDALRARVVELEAVVKSSEFTLEESRNYGRGKGLEAMQAREHSAYVSSVLDAATTNLTDARKEAAALREALERRCWLHRVPNNEHETEAHYRHGKHGWEHTKCELTPEEIAALAAVPAPDAEPKREVVDKNSRAYRHGLEDGEARLLEVAERVRLWIATTNGGKSFSKTAWEEALPSLVKGGGQ